MSELGQQRQIALVSDESALPSITDMYRNATNRRSSQKPRAAYHATSFNSPTWPAPGSADTELGVLMEPEVSHGATKVYAGVQA
jgi:hypothetical protein